MFRSLAVFSMTLVLLLGSRWSLAQAKPGEWEFPKDWFWHDDDTQRAKHAELLGKPAPKLSLANWKNGEVKPDDMKGKVVVVDLWATWCGPCIASIPHNNELWEKYKDKGVVLIGVCTSGNGQDKFEDVVKEKGIKYPAATDPKLETEKAWRVMWYPTYAVVDKKGILRAIGLQPPFVEKVVEKLLAEDAPKAASNYHPVKYAMAANADKGAEWRKRDLKELEGKAPPALALEKWINGDAMKLADLKGKVVVLDFWATWCGPCIASIPHTNEMLAKYKDKGLVVIGVCHTEGADQMADTVKSSHIEYPVASDIEGKTVKGFNVDSFPDYYLIDRSGKLRIADCKNDSVEEAVQALLNESAPSADAK